MPSELKAPMIDGMFSNKPKQKCRTERCGIFTIHLNLQPTLCGRMLTAECSLPDVASVGADHFLASLAAKRFGKVRAVLQRAIRAVLAGRMRIGLGQQP